MTFWSNAAGFLNVVLVLNFVAVSTEWYLKSSSICAAVTADVALKYSFTWTGQSGPEHFGSYIAATVRQAYRIEINCRGESYLWPGIETPKQVTLATSTYSSSTHLPLTCQKGDKEGEGGGWREAHASNNFVCACHKRQLTG